MKEMYFTSDSIIQKSRGMLEKIKRQVSYHDAKFTSDKSALLVMDMQKYFLKKASHAYIPSAPAIIHGIDRLVSEFSQKRIPIIFTRHINTDQNARLMAGWWKDLIRAEDPMSEIIDELDTSMGEILEKSQYDAFFQTPLEDYLRKRDVRQIVICGVMTHLCCETTARSGFVRGFEIFFPVDGTATYNESFHLATLLNLSHGFAVPVLLEGILTLLRDEDEY